MVVSLVLVVSVLTFEAASLFMLLFRFRPCVLYEGPNEVGGVYVDRSNGTDCVGS